MQKDPILLQEVKSSISKETDDLKFMLDFLSQNNVGVIDEIITAVDPTSILGESLTKLKEKIESAKKNVLPELNKLIQKIEDNMPKPTLEDTNKNIESLVDSLDNINF